MPQMPYRAYASGHDPRHLADAQAAGATLESPVVLAACGVPLAVANAVGEGVAASVIVVAGVNVGGAGMSVAVAGIAVGTGV